MLTLFCRHRKLGIGKIRAMINKESSQGPHRMNQEVGLVEARGLCSKALVEV